MWFRNQEDIENQEKVREDTFISLYADKEKRILTEKRFLIDGIRKQAVRIVYNFVREL